MRFAVVAAMAVAAATASVPTYDGYTYDMFLAEHRPAMLLTGEKPCPARKAVFEANLATIKAHNAQGRSWFMKVNEHADMTEEEFLAFYTGLDKSSRNQARLTTTRAATRIHNDFAISFKARRQYEDVSALPVSADWSSTIKTALNQGQCGSCWAFAAAHTFIGRANIASGKDVSVSAQQITSCTPNPRKCGGSGGCQGATFQLAADYITKEGFLTTAEAYPYTSGSTGSTGSCKLDASMPRALTIGGYTELPKNNKTALLAEVAKGGPVSVSVAASKWFLYGGGVFDGCTSSKDGIVNHAVTMTGYQLEGTPYVSILNSWGKSWGENGYIRLKMYDSEPVTSDTSPHSGAACADEPSVPYDVVGECGVFSDSAFPEDVKA